MASLNIGWGKADLTPIGEICKKVSLVGQFHERITDMVRDRIYATAIALESSDGGKAIVVSIDLAFTPEALMAGAREKLKELAPDFPPELLIIAATHIHTGPYMRSNSLPHLWGDRFTRFSDDPDVVSPQAYVEFAAGKIAEAAARAWNGREPGGIANAFGRVAVPHCRRVRYKDGRAEMYGGTDTERFLRIEGGADTGVEYIAAFDKSGKMSGVVINLACPAQVIEHQYYISADMWGEVRRQWPECNILPLCGAAGDITMRDLVRRGRCEQNMASPEGMAQQAARIVRESEFVLSGIKSADIKYELPVGHIMETVPLPLRTVTEDDCIEARAIYDEIENECNADPNAVYPDSTPLPMDKRAPYASAAGVIGRFAMQAEMKNIEAEIHALRVGDAVLVTNPFELFQDFGMCMKARSPADQTLIAQLCCGNFGYLPTAYGITGGSYSSGISNGFVGPEGGDVLVEKTLDMIKRLF